MITAPLPRASPSGSGRLSMIIPRYYGLTITYSILHILTIVFPDRLMWNIYPYSTEVIPDSRNVKYQPIFHGSYSMAYYFFSSRHAHSIVMRIA